MGTLIIRERPAMGPGFLSIVFPGIKQNYGSPFCIIKRLLRNLGYPKP